MYERARSYEEINIERKIERKNGKRKKERTKEP